MKPGPGDLDRSDRRQRFELRLDRLGKRARIGPRRLGEHHRRVGRKIAVRRIARRLDRHVPAVEARRQRAFGNKLVEHSVEERGILGVKAQIAVTDAGKRRRLAQQPAARHALNGAGDR